jgi:hypothetical protein
MENNGRGLYFVLWAVWPIVFFTPSRNIIATYPLPALPALAILLAEIARNCTRDDFSWKRLHPLHPALAVTSLAAIVLLGTVSTVMPDLAPKRTERDLVRIYDRMRANDDQLVYFGGRRYSAEFYSEGEATATDSIDSIQQKLDSPGHLFIAMKSKNMNSLPPCIQRRLIPVTHWPSVRANLFVERNTTLDIVGIEPMDIHPNSQ